MKKDPVLVGHQPRWAALARAFAKGEVPQTLLISGPPQTGKWTFALRYAQLLLCPDTQPDADGLPSPCGRCRICHQVEIGTFPDFIVCRPIVSSAKEERDWVTAPDTLEGSIITVDMARKFGTQAIGKPLVGPRKVMVINQAERMNGEAQNALLKTFEEPGLSLSIILLSDNPSQMLATVRSRCWHLPLGLAPNGEIAGWLGENFPDAPRDLINEAVRVAAGRPGAAWRELRRLQREPTNGKAASGKAARQEAEKDIAQEPILPRSVQAAQIVERITRSQPVAALALTEEALRLARLWWADDQADEASAKKEIKADAKVLRSAVARFLDELSTAYRTCWAASVDGSVQKAPSGPRQTVQDAGAWADGLDQIRKTRHYILRNANTNLALDVMFGRLIATHGVVATPVRAGRRN